MVDECSICPMVKQMWSLTFMHCLYFWHFTQQLNLGAYLLGSCEPSSPSTKELHGFTVARICLRRSEKRLQSKSRMATTPQDLFNSGTLPPKPLRSYLLPFNPWMSFNPKLSVRQVSFAKKQSIQNRKKFVQVYINCHKLSGLRPCVFFLNN